MKILFSASVSGRDKFENNYKQIENTLTSLGHELTTTVFLATKDELQVEDKKESDRYFKNLIAWIKDADIVVMETSYPSVGVGYEIATALHLGKPVIALHVKNSFQHFLRQIIDDKLQVIEYTDNNLDKELKTAVGYASDQQDTRFNFFISPKHQNYLDWISKSRKIPRAVFLRGLIEKAMKTEQADS